MALASFSCSSYIEGASGVKMPEKTEVIEVFENSQWLHMEKLKIHDTDNIGSFIRRSRLHELKLQEKHGITGDIYLRPENRISINRNCRYYFSECENNFYKYRILLNADSGELWIEIVYPDFSGKF